MLRLYHGDECLTIPAHDVESPQRSVTNLMNKVEYKVLGAELLECSSQILRQSLEYSNPVHKQSTPTRYK